MVTWKYEFDSIISKVRVLSLRNRRVVFHVKDG